MDLEISQRALTSTLLRRLGSDTSYEVQIAGDATKWLLQICDGRSLVLPVVYPCGLGVTPSPKDMVQAIVTVDEGDTPKISERWSDDECVVDPLLVSAMEALEFIDEMDRMQLLESG